MQQDRQLIGKSVIFHKFDIKFNDIMIYWANLTEIWKFKFHYLQYQSLKQFQMQKVVTQIGNYSYYPDKILGQGATGSVYMGFRNYDRYPVAVKVIKLKEINTAVKRHLLDCEVAALSTIKNRYVCQTYDIMKDSEFYFIPIEYFPNGTLKDLIKKKGKLSQNQALQMFSKILQGYWAITKQAGFIHRDLKSENILLRANMEPVIIDFGYAEKIQTQGRRMPYNVGSPAYMSPQAYNDSQYSEKSDVWALGIVLHEMLTGAIPIMRTTNVDEYFKYLKNMKTAQIIRGQQNQLCTKLLLHALAVDIRLRYSTEQLINQMKNNKANMNKCTILKTNSPNIECNPLQKPPILTKVLSNGQKSGNLRFCSPQHKHKKENEHFWNEITQTKMSISTQQSNAEQPIPTFQEVGKESSQNIQRSMSAHGLNNLKKQFQNPNMNLAYSDSLKRNENTPFIYPQVKNFQTARQPIAFNGLSMKPLPNQTINLQTGHTFTNINVTLIRGY